MNFMLHDHDAFDESDTQIIPDTVLEAVRTLLRWSGDDPDREGLVDTPKRVARAWQEYCSGYQENPALHLDRTFEDVGGYDEIVLLKDIPFHSHCEHHLAPSPARRRSPICRGTGSSAYRNSPACCMAMPAACRCRNG